MDELWNMLPKFGISCDRKFVSALFREFDTNKNGVMEFEEFVSFVIHNPYK
jgi:Ca2+-binding EF-hand superfamily protein